MRKAKRAHACACIAILLATAGCGSGLAPEATVPSAASTGEGSLPEGDPDVAAKPVVELVLTLDVPEANVVASAEYLLTGQVAGHSGTLEADYALNADDAGPLALQQGEFEALLTLEPGLNSIVVTADDATGVSDIRSIQLYYARFDGIDLADPRLMRLRPLVADIYHSYGLSESSPALQRTRALRDWVARHMVHPDRRLHPDGSQANSGVLPIERTWSDVNRVNDPERIASDQAFWASFDFDGYAMIDALLGSLDPDTGLRSDSGYMTRVDVGRYRIREIDTFPFSYCTYQVSVLQVLWGTAGFQSIALSSNGHDPAAVFVPGTGWVYSDPTFNEEYQLDADAPPLAPADLMELVKTGQAERVRPQTGIGGGIEGPIWDPAQYIDAEETMYFSYLAAVPGDFGYLRALLNSDIVGGAEDRRVVTVGPHSDEDPAPGPIVDATLAFPNLQVDVIADAR